MVIVIIIIIRVGSQITVHVCRDDYEAKSDVVQATVAAANARLQDEVSAVKAGLEAEVEAVKAEAAKAAGRAKAQRQTAHIADREARQAEIKEIITDRWDCLRQACSLMSVF